MLIDSFLIYLIEEYEFYKSEVTPPAPYEYDMWRDVVLILEKLQPRLI